MNLLRVERQCLERYLPGLDAQLRDVPLLELEKAGSCGLSLFRAAGGPRLIVAAADGGLGADAVTAARIQRAIGARSPSLAIATTMHHFSVASIVELAKIGSGLEWAMLQAITEHNWLLASAFAEGNPAQPILAPTMTAVRVPGGLQVTGTKKPCSLTWSMNILTASVRVTEDDGSERFAVIMVPATSEGIERRPFWNSWILAAAESDEVSLQDVFVPDAMVFFPTDRPSVDPVQGQGFVWFELLATASYIGIATALVERVMTAGRGSAHERVQVSMELESAMAAVEAVAATVNAVGAEQVEDQLARALCVRFAAEGAITRASTVAAGLAGGMAFIRSSEIAYLVAACQALGFHPPSRASVSASLDGYFLGHELAV